MSLNVSVILILKLPTGQERKNVSNREIAKIVRAMYLVIIKLFDDKKSLDSDIEYIQSTLSNQLSLNIDGNDQ